MREVAAQAERPVMLYSIGKDSSVMLHLALKAFYPSPPPFPLLHVDTTWKFQEMYEFRDQMAREHGHGAARPHQRGGVAQGINPFTHGSAVHTDMMKTAGAQAGARPVPVRRRVRRRAARRGEVARQGARLLVPLRAAPLGPEEPAARAVAPLQRPQAAGASRSACSRSPTGPSSTSGSTSTASTSRSCRSISPQERPVVERDGTLIMVDDDRMPLEPGETAGACAASASARSAAIRSPARSRATRTRCRRSSQEMLLDAHLRAPGPPDRPRPARSMEKKKQEGYF